MTEPRHERDRSPLAISIGSEFRIPIDKKWGLRFSSAVNIGYDQAQVTVPVGRLLEADASLIGDLTVWDTERDDIVWQGYIESADLVRQRRVVRIRAKGVGHELSRMKGTLLTLNTETPEIARNVAAAAGLDPHVAGYAPAAGAYRVSKGIFGVRTATKELFGPQEVGPLLASDERGVVDALGVSKRAHRRDAWSSGILVTTTIAEEGFWEAILAGGDELFRGVALLQFQWLSGSARRLAAQGPAHFRCYWRAPAVALSGSTLARRLDDAASVVMSRARILRRPRRTSQAEMQLAIKEAGKQLKAIEDLPKKQRRPLLDAVHLFVRATETSDLGTALLFYSGAVDRMTQLAPSRRIFSSAELKKVRKAVRDVCGEDDEKQARADHLVKLLNDAPWKERLIRVAQAKDVTLSKRELADIERLYKMRNLLVHEGARPDSAINFQLRHGLAVLDRLISAWLPW